jgi:hypothetical protein
MNRRTFLKSVGVAVAVISVPAIAIAKPKPKWISFADEMPKVGQKVIIASQVSVMSSISGGIVVDNTKGEKFSHPYSTLCTIDDFFVNHSDDHSFALFYTEKGREVISTRDWIKREEEAYIYPRDFTNEKQRVHRGGYYSKHYFWMAVDGEYPTTIPPIPRNHVYDELEGIKPGELNTMFADFGIRRKRSNNINQWPSHCLKGKS